MRSVRTFVAAAVVTAAVSVFGADGGERPGYLGFAFTCHTHSTSRSTTQWLTVRMIAPAGPAERAGLRVGDIITAVDGRAIAFTDELDAILLATAAKPGEKVSIDILRDRQPHTIQLTPTAMADPQYAEWKANVEMLQARRAATDKRK